ncbi:hypothetical protein MAXJ12_36301 [Mesorhizobium alhagi CCNWXJ12-2]|uniref:Uncharacterized protein n=1 Tax=Mesorhizobium alhagi CCNWXJ12-2 TaxID=1107882 RepID=H0I437_9HYPH|nr:hypothetical protein MAXJ12_36301 [Mesorhizobium alhagi CCNWXJ12-2]
MDAPELGYVALSDLDSLRGPFGSLVDYDMTFAASKPLSAHADDARRRGFIAAQSKGAWAHARPFFSPSAPLNRT